MGRRAGMLRLVIFLAVVGCFARTAAASDVDGFFCVGPDYFAYEFEDGGHTPVGHPGLYVVRLSGSDGFSEPVVYEFKPGPVRGMRCEDKHVQLVDDESIRTIDLDGPRTPLGVRIEREPLPGRGVRPDGFVLLNLGELSHLQGATWPETVPLPSTTRFSYALAVTKTAGVPQNHLFACNPASVTYLDQFDANRNLVRSLEIAAGCDRSQDSTSTTRP
jgi:hypothetical protein